MHKSIYLIFLMLLCLTSTSIADTWALLVGINDYQDSRISDLNYTVNDVTRFRDVLIDKDACAVPKDKVYLMTNNSIGDELPTNTNVIFRLENLVSRIKPEDTFIFYFSGHGMMRDGKQYLLTINSDSRSLTTLAASAIPQDTIHELLNKVKAHQVLVILDSCRNDPEKGKGDKDNTLTDEIARGFIMKSRSAPDGMPGSSATLYASSVGERAYEWDSMKSGVFSYYLVEGLKGACIDANNEVTLRGLANYVMKNVRGWSLDNLPTGKCQTPWLVSEGAADMTLAKIGKLDVHITQIVPSPPSDSGFSLNDLKNEADKLEAIEKVKKAQDSKLEEMKTAYIDIKAYEGRNITPNIKSTAWQRFIDSFKEDNPYSLEDDNMRQESKKQLDYWNRQISKIRPKIDTSSKTISREDDTKMVIISPKEAFAASLIVPGLGQHLQGRYKQGLTYEALVIGSVIAAVYARSYHEDTRSDYLNLLKDNTASTNVIETYYNKAKSARTLAIATQIMVGISWGINLLDIILTDNSIKSKDATRLKIESTFNGIRLHVYSPY